MCLFIFIFFYFHLLTSSDVFGESSDTISGNTSSRGADVESAAMEDLSDEDDEENIDFGVDQQRSDFLSSINPTKHIESRDKLRDVNQQQYYLSPPHARDTENLGMGIGTRKFQ